MESFHSHGKYVRELNFILVFLSDLLQRTGDVLVIKFHNDSDVLKVRKITWKLYSELTSFELNSRLKYIFYLL